MKLSWWLVRGLSILSLVLGGILLDFGSAIVTAQLAHAQSVNSIAVEGNRRVEADTIRSYFKPGPGGRLGALQIDEAYKALFATGLFQDVQIRTAGGRIVVTVVENPVIDRIAFEGNSRVKDEQLKLEIQSKERGTFSRALVQSDVQRIIDVYRRTGRFDVTINPKVIDLPNNRVDLVFEIKEGSKTTVKEIDFVGNHAYSGYRLRDVIKTTATNLLSFLQSSNIYDPDRIEADRELLRRFYLTHGYIDVRIVSATGEYIPARKGFVVTFTIEEGQQYRVGTLDVVSNVHGLAPGLVRSRVRLGPGEVYNADAMEKSVEDMTIEASRQGFAFATVRPRADRDPQAKRVNLVFTIEEGSRVYIEQINIRGNTRTRDYVIRREFDLAEGDPYNRALISRAERRLKNLNFFKDVKITTEPGSAPDRVIINVNVEEQSTGEFSIAGGFSTTDGFLGEVAIGERNLLGRGLYAKASVQYGQHASGAQLSFVEPYLLGYRIALGVDLFQRITTATDYVSYDTRTTGGGLRFGFPLREDFGIQLRYSLYGQKVSLPYNLENCNNINPDFVTTFPTPIAFASGAYSAQYAAAGSPAQSDCYADGEASLAVRRELSQGAVLTSLVGYDVNYNTLDNNKSPTSGLLATLKQDFAGAGGDVQFIRTTGDLRSYYEVLPDVVGVLHLQGGHLTSFNCGGINPKASGPLTDNSCVRMLDHFQMGPQLVRGFAPSGIGPRDLTQYNFNGLPGDALGGTMYWGASLEFQTPIFFAPKDFGIKLALFADAGSLWNYAGPTSWLTGPGATGETLTTTSLAGVNSSNMFINSSIGAGVLWASPFGPIRFDFAYPVTKQPFDRTQWFRFSGGTTF